MKVLRKCQQLDEDGKRCNCTSVQKYAYHGDPSLHSYPNWVEVYLCRKHQDILSPTRITLKKRKV